MERRFRKVKYSVIALLAIFSCSRSTEEILINRWYFKGMIDLHTNEKSLIIQRCMYVDLKADYTYLDQTNFKGSWNLKEDSLILFLPDKVVMRCKMLELSEDQLILKMKMDDNEYRVELVKRPDFCDWVEQDEEK